MNAAAARLPSFERELQVQLELEPAEHARETSSTHRSTKEDGAALEREYGQNTSTGKGLAYYIYIYIYIYNSTAAALAEETVTWSLRGPHRDTGGPG